MFTESESRQVVRILISPIGNRDPYSPDGTEGAALTICRYLEPDIVYLLPTAERPDVRDSTHQNARKTQKEINIISPDIRVYIKDMDINDPTDFDRILPEMERILARIQEETDFEREFYFNVTSATPQIQASCLLAVTSGIISAKALQVADPRYASGNLRVREVPTMRLQESGILDKITHLHAELMFDACVEELENLKQLTPSRPRRDVAEIWQLLCQSYSALDRLNYKSSRCAMCQVARKLEHISQFQAIEDLLNNQLSTLDRLSQGDEKENELILTDIYHNARRCSRRGAYADALARVWRVLEGGMFYYLRHKYGIEPNDLSQSPCFKSPESSGDLASNIIRKFIMEGRKDLSFESSRTLLQEKLEDKPFHDFLTERVTLRGKQKQLGGLMEGIRQRRNESVVAHGVKPVEEETAQTGIDLAEHFMHFLFPGIELEQHPFTLENLGLVGQSMRQVI
jgi:hypothetical protein